MSAYVISEVEVLDERLIETYGREVIPMFGEVAA